MLTSAVPPSSRDLNSVAHALCHRMSHVTRHASLAFLLMRARLMMRGVLHAWQQRWKSSKRVGCWMLARDLKMKMARYSAWRKLCARHVVYLPPQPLKQFHKTLTIDVILRARSKRAGVMGVMVHGVMFTAIRMILNVWRGHVTSCNRLRSHVTRHTSHVTRHTSRISRVSAQITRRIAQPFSQTLKSLRSGSRTLRRPTPNNASHKKQNPKPRSIPHQTLPTVALRNDPRSERRLAPHEDESRRAQRKAGDDSADGAGQDEQEGEDRRAARVAGAAARAAVLAFADDAHAVACAEGLCWAVEDEGGSEQEGEDHMSLVDCTSHVTRQTSHITRHTSNVTRHTHHAGSFSAFHFHQPLQSIRLQGILPQFSSTPPNCNTCRLKTWRRVVARSRAFNAGALAALQASQVETTLPRVSSRVGSSSMSRNSSPMVASTQATPATSAMLSTSWPSAASAPAAAAASPAPPRSRRSLHFINANDSAYDNVRQGRLTKEASFQKQTLNPLCCNPEPLVL
jgi:hypothetical protein